MVNTAARASSWDNVPEDVGFGAPSAADDGPAVFRQILSALRRRKFLVATVALVLMCGATAAMLLMPKTYLASSKVVVDWKRPEPVRGVGSVLEDSPFGTDTMGTELELLNSREILEAAVKTLNLTADPEFNPHIHPSLLSRANQTVHALAQRWLPEAWQPSSDTADTHVDPELQALNDTIAAVREHLDLSLIGLSRVIRISFKSHQPETASRVANTIAQLYVDAELGVGERATEKAHDWIDRRLAELRARADNAARAVEEYRISHDMTRGKDATILQQEITEVSSQLTIAQQKAAEASDELQDATRAAASHNLAYLGSILNSLTVQKLREMEAQAAGRVAEMSQRYGPSSPVLGPATAQLAQIRGLLKAEEGRILQSIADKVKVARANEAGLSTRLAELKARVAQSERDTIPLRALQREADVDRDLYTSFLNRFRETDPSNNYAATNVRILSKAATPTSPYFPQLSYLLPLALVGSIGVSMVGVVTWENLRRGLVSMDQVAELLKLTPLGLIPFCRLRGSVREQMIFREAVSDLLGRVLSTEDGIVPRSILVTSAVPQEGKTTVARALAHEAMDQGRRVLLIDADLRLSSLSASTKVTHDVRGLAEVLRGEVTLDQAIHNGRVGQVPLLPAGNCVGSPSHILESPMLPALLRHLEQEYDLVVIDSPPVLIAGDAWRLARCANTTLLLARWKSTPVEQVALAIRRLGVAPAKLAGLALSMVNTNENSTYLHSDAVLFSSSLQRYYAPQAKGSQLARRDFGPWPRSFRR